MADEMTLFLRSACGGLRYEVYPSLQHFDARNSRSECFNSQFARMDCVVLSEEDFQLRSNQITRTCCRFVRSEPRRMDLLATCWRHNGFVHNISTRQDVVDKSVGDKMLRVDLLYRFAV